MKSNRAKTSVKFLLMFLALQFISRFILIAHIFIDTEIQYRLLAWIVKFDNGDIVWCNEISVSGA